MQACNFGGQGLVLLQDPLLVGTEPVDLVFERFDVIYFALAMGAGFALAT